MFVGIFMIVSLSVMRYMVSYWLERFTMTLGFPLIIDVSQQGEI